MATNFVGFLNTYDLFGKSIPGALFMLGIYFLFPYEILINISSNGSVNNVLALLLSSVIVGLLAGEAIHTMARIIEIVVYISLKSLLRITRYIIDTVQWIVAEGRAIQQDEFEPIEPEEEQSKVQILREYLRITLSPVKSIFSSLYWGSVFLFSGHRHLFDETFQWNYTAEGPWELEEKGALYDEFVDLCKQRYSVDISDKEQEAGNIYPIIASRVSAGSSGLSQRFQDLYSFCRSMWVVLLLLLVLYGISIIPLTYNTGFSSVFEPYHYNPEISKQFYLFILASIVLSMLLFMYAARRYKKAYIQYLIADFINTNEDSSEVDDKQTDIRRFGV